MINILGILILNILSFVQYQTRLRRDGISSITYEVRNLLNYAGKLEVHEASILLESDYEPLIKSLSETGLK